MRNSVKFSGGWGRDILSKDSFRYDTAPSLGATYGYRVMRHLEMEAGAMVALGPGHEQSGASYYFKPDDRFTWVPFGLRGILPLRHDRIELSAAAGGLYEKYSVSNPALSVGLAARDGWGGYFAGGVKIAVDRKRHIWLGAAPHWYLANTRGGYAHDRWFVITGDAGFRF
jgi:hypothetical protein